MNDAPEQRRASDKGAIPRFWNWIDERDIIRMIALIGVASMSLYMMLWSIDYAGRHDCPGMGTAATITAVMAPVNVALAWMFSAFGK